VQTSQQQQAEGKGAKKSAAGGGKKAAAGGGKRKKPAKGGEGEEGGSGGEEQQEAPAPAGPKWGTVKVREAEPGEGPGRHGDSVVRGSVVEVVGCQAVSVYQCVGHFLQPAGLAAF